MILLPEVTTFCKGQHCCSLGVVFIFTFAAVLTNRPLANISSLYHVMAPVDIHMSTTNLKVLNTRPRSRFSKFAEIRWNHQEEIKVVKAHKVAASSPSTIRFPDLIQA